MLKKNLLVIGDLILDHTLFVGAERPLSVPGETRLPVEQRQNTAGGAANTARIISRLSFGKTYLWGISGPSRWGSFRKILEDSQILDGVEQEQRIELLGINAEADAPITTITRLLQRKRHDELERILRIDDPMDAHVNDDAAQSSLKYHLERIHHPESPLHGIVINDFGKGCLTTATIQYVAKFANDHHIPLFIDPKRRRHNYSDIRATAILPNLTEWCHLVSDSNNYDVWRGNLDEPEMLWQMAARSFRHLGAFHFHVITCDQEGAVVIARDPKLEHQYAVYRARPPKPDEKHIQLGCGDTLTGVLALELAGDNERPSTPEVLRAFSRANLLVARYRDMGWHRMPDRARIQRWSKAQAPQLPKASTTVGTSVLVLPRDEHVVLRSCATAIPGLYSQDDTYQKTVAALVSTLINGWEPQLRSVVLGAPSGSGKSETIKALPDLLKQHGIHVDNYTDKFAAIDTKNLKAFFSDHSNQKPTPCNKLLFVIDECLKGSHKRFFAKYGVPLLECAHSFGVRFLFIDAGFRDGTTEQHNLDSQFFSRCDLFFYSGLQVRPKDAPVIVAANLKKSADPKEIRSVRIHRGALLALLDGVFLRGHNARDLAAQVERTFARAFKQWDGGGSFEIRAEHVQAASRGDAHVFELEPTWFNVEV